MGVHDWWAGPVCASPDLVDTPIGENNCKWLRTNPHESPKAHASCIEHLTKALPMPILDAMPVPPQVQDYDPIRALLPVTMSLIVLLVVGMIYPVVVALAQGDDGPRSVGHGPLGMCRVRPSLQG